MKKGQLDLLDNGMDILFLLAVVLIGGIVLYSFSQNITSMEIFDYSGLDPVKNFINNFPVMIDFLIPIAMVLVTIASVITARTQILDRFSIGIRIFVGLLLFPLFLMVGYVMQFIINLPVFDNVVSQMTITPFFLTYIGFFGALYQFVVVMAYLSAQ